MTYQVHITRQLGQPPAITDFTEPQPALNHAASAWSDPYHLIQFHIVETGEWLTYAQFAHRWTSGGLNR